MTTPGGTKPPAAKDVSRGIETNGMAGVPIVALPRPNGADTVNSRSFHFPMM